MNTGKYLYSHHFTVFTSFYVKLYSNINTRFPNNGVTFDATTQSTSNHLLYSINDENWCGFGCEPDGSFTIRVGTWNEGKHVFKIWTNGSFTLDDKPIATTKNLQDLIVRKHLDFEEISLNVGETIVPYDLTPIIDGYNLVTVLHPDIAYISSHVPARVTFTQYSNVSGDMRIYSDTQVKIRLFLEVLLTKK